MGELTLGLVRWLIKFGPWIGAVLAFFIVMNMGLSMILVGFNAGAFSDVYAIVSMWLPFNLNELFMWVTTASSAYILYRLAWVTVIWINRVLG